MLVSVDMEQIEFRLAVDVSGQEDFLEEIIRGRDPHILTAQQFFNCKKPTDKQREVGKTGNYAGLYGAGVGKLVRACGLTFDEARGFLDWFYEKYDKVQTMIDEAHQFVEEHSFIISPYGRRRDFVIPDGDADLLAAAQREGLNHMFQSMGHDTLLVYWLLIRHHLGRECVLVTNEAHDELILDAPKKRLDNIKAICYNGFTMVAPEIKRRFGYQLRVPITGQVKVGRSWP